MPSPPADAELARLLNRLSASSGMCEDCRYLRLVESARSVFVRCRLADEDPLFRRYPPLPVRQCHGYEPSE